MQLHLPYSKSTDESSLNSHGDDIRRDGVKVTTRWYRLAAACSILNNNPREGRLSGHLQLAIDWASQILYHLGSEETPLFQPEPKLVEKMAFAIDQYFIVMYVSSRSVGESSLTAQRI